VLGQRIVLAEGELPFPPKVEDFYLPPIIEGTYPWLTKFTVLVWLAVAVLVAFFVLAYRDPKLVPTKWQWIAESIYGFGRDNIARDMIGPEGARFAPYLTTLLSFLVLTNLFGIIPGIQISPNSHIAFPVTLAIISYVMFIYIGFRRHGLGYIKQSLVLPAPWFVQPILIPIEFASTFIIRPFTLAVRLFANMFAGHVIILVFTLGGFLLLNAESLFIKPISLVSWAMALAITFLEVLVALLQAYVFTVLTASYIQGSLAEEH
jgi:F-type H+-transporting ATPase subunit a